jgi:hypothetical protein
MRKLVPAFALRGRILAWRCSVCGKLFVNPEGDAEAAALPSRWTNEFRRHLCAANVRTQLPLERAGSDSR